MYRFQPVLSFQCLRKCNCTGTYDRYGRWTITREIPFFPCTSITLHSFLHSLPLLSSMGHSSILKNLSTITKVKQAGNQSIQLVKKSFIQTIYTIRTHYIHKNTLHRLPVLEQIDTMNDSTRYTSQTVSEVFSKWHTIIISQLESHHILHFTHIVPI